MFFNLILHTSPCIAPQYGNARKTWCPSKSSQCLCVSSAFFLLPTVRTSEVLHQEMMLSSCDSRTTRLVALLCAAPYLNSALHAHAGSHFRVNFLQVELITSQEAAQYKCVTGRLDSFHLFSPPCPTCRLIHMFLSVLFF